LPVIWNYIIGQSPHSKEISLHNGIRIHLSSHNHDIRTVFVVFVKKEYMKIERDSIILDIGANIGAFSLFACQYKPKIIYAVEPALESFKTLQRNIILNNLENIIKPYWNFIATTDDLEAEFPVKSSPYNKLFSPKEGEEVARVSSLTINKLIEANNIDKVDYLKIDCEGCEYDIFFNMDDATFDKINNIVMEYHKGPLDELIGHF
jgi:FkbM family methyltransferase